MNTSKTKLIKLTGLLFFALATGYTISVIFPVRGLQNTGNTPNPSTAIAAQVQPPTYAGDSNFFVELSKRVVPAVVNISTSVVVQPEQGRARGGPGSPDEFFRRFFGEMMPGGPGQFGQRERMPPGDEDETPSPRQSRPGRKNGISRSMSLGTGFIIDSSGLILTNHHVIKGADEVKVQFTEQDEDPTEAEIIGSDPELDLALLKVKTSKSLISLPLGNSESLQVGEFVVAVGNPFGHGHSVTHGIISAKDRKNPESNFSRYIQTDASINPGNSGGPLINLQGEVIGINNAIDARAQGIGFAIPINSVKNVLEQLKTNGSVARGYIGILFNPLTPEVAEQIEAPKSLKGTFVAHVYPGQPADKAGVKPYDVITAVNGQKVAQSGDLVELIAGIPVGQSAKLKIWRKGKELEVSIKVAERPSSVAKANGKPKNKDKKNPTIQPPIETGMTLENITPEIAKELGLSKPEGIVVVDLDYNGPAARAGFQQGDVIAEVKQTSVRSVTQFFELVKEKKSYLVRVRRLDPRGQDAFVVLVLDLKD